MNRITQDELARWLDGLALDRTLIAPRWVDGVLLYRTVSGSAEIAWEGAGAARRLTAQRPVTSVKEVFFPPTERLLTIEKTGQTFELGETLPEGEQVVFGVRPCDARGVRVLDALFLDAEPLDPYYARRRADTTLIGVACPALGPTCFCTSVGGAPDDARDVDVMLAEVEGGYAAEAITEKGAALLREAGGWTSEAPAARPAQPAAADAQPWLPPDPAAIAWPPRFDDAYWERMAERCLGCRICAYVCPTCRCFTVRDEALEPANGHNRYERIRCWDSCAGPAYRRIAGGHNPRPTKGQRLRNRFFCKFYYYPEQYGPSACTGCGRCIDACPVNIDIVEVLAHLAATQEVGL